MRKVELKVKLPLGHGRSLISSSGSFTSAQSFLRKDNFDQNPVPKILTQDDPSILVIIDIGDEG